MSQEIYIGATVAIRRLDSEWINARFYLGAHVQDVYGSPAEIGAKLKDFKLPEAVRNQLR